MLRRRAPPLWRGAPSAVPAAPERRRDTGAGRLAALVAAVGSRTHQRLRLVLDGQDAVADRKPVADREILQRARGLGADMVVMGGLAADHAAERDKPVKPPAGRGGQRDRRRDLEGAGHRGDLAGRPGSGNRALGTLPQQRGKVRIIGRLDEQQVRSAGHGGLCSKFSERALSSRAT